ncbi:MAG: radical SAM protein [Lentisphaerae bacterium RIFOXYA12_FULL_48_11]|nr:MAG: radical SAM protein [Lentisphaerae bacterium RIFOXYA12_FULL_48_11]
MKENKKHTREQYGFKEGASEFPLMVVLSFVYVCNARCPNCPYNNSEIRDTYKDALFMPEVLFKRIADECGQYRSYLRLSGGGEPMLHPQAVDLIVYAKQKGAKIGLITNGSRFSEQNLRKILGAGIDVIEFSVDAGDEETYRIVRPGVDWGVLNRNVKLANSLRKEMGVTTTFVASIINQKGVDVEKAEKYWSELVDKVQIRKYLTWGYNQDQSADSSPYLPPGERIPCPWLFERLNIDSKGDVTLCGEDIAFSEKFDNVYNHSIRKIWRGGHFESLRKKHLERRGEEIKICSTCPDWQYRSWEYNYWKILKDAEVSKKAKG